MDITNNDKGLFIISLDFELFWGVWDVTWALIWQHYELYKQHCKEKGIPKIHYMIP